MTLLKEPYVLLLHIYHVYVHHIVLLKLAEVSIRDQDLDFHADVENEGDYALDSQTLSKELADKSGNCYDY